jgi:hypothetical protein
MIVFDDLDVHRVEESPRLLGSRFVDKALHGKQRLACRAAML